MFSTSLKVQRNMRSKWWEQRYDTRVALAATGYHATMPCSTRSRVWGRGPLLDKQEDLAPFASCLLKQGAQIIWRLVILIVAIASGDCPASFSFQDSLPRI